MRSARGNIRSVQAESRLARADSPQRGPTRARQGPTHARRRPAHAQGGLAHLQRGPMRPQRGRCTLSAGRETFARKVFRVSRLKSLVFQKLALGLINGSRPSPKRQRSHQALSSRHAAGAREKALEARQSIGKHSENSHFETQSANFLPKARAARPDAPPSQSKMTAHRDALFSRSQSRTPRRPSFPKPEPHAAAPLLPQSQSRTPRRPLFAKPKNSASRRHRTSSRANHTRRNRKLSEAQTPRETPPRSRRRSPLHPRRISWRSIFPHPAHRTPMRFAPGCPAALQRSFPGNPARSAPRHPAACRSVSSPHLRNRRRRRTQRRALRPPALRIGVKDDRHVDAVAPERYGSQT